ncbi:D-alanine--D-alanine ligase [Alkaliphilus pronyensis]|uniref:D-alanine--D-alanine ligase n=1 Tax=Alkaliphilus pronyensis TaxID=1482732 RepID=A0A6I0FR28_9FIRM|nr:D-alanine--D-alanine ligase [Alkaliphilus pronyensis]KAB3541009.1 D-alanine--D-alanine ligase [Alkaliphilus pronyensis]
MKKTNVMVLFGGKSHEHEVSLMSAASILRAINKEKYNIIPVVITKEGNWQRYNSTVKEIESGEWEGIKNMLLNDEKTSSVSLIPQKSNSGSIALGGTVEDIDVVFPVLHGPFGEDGTIQGLLETINVPYVGAGVLASAVAMDKAVVKALFKAEDIPQADYTVVYRKKYEESPIRELEAIEERLKYPVFVKPANLGSSVGISKARNRQQLMAAIEEASRYDRKIVIEENINAREIECSVLGNDEPIASLPAEIIPSHEFYDYQDKYFDGKTQFIIPADLPKETIEKIRSLAIKVYRLIDCSGLARVDFFIEKSTNRILINEINTMPGFTKISMYPKMWEASGIKYEELINRLIDLAIERFNERN